MNELQVVKHNQVSIISDEHLTKHLRLTASEFDEDRGFILEIVAGAVAEIEQRLGRKLLAQDYKETIHECDLEFVSCKPIRQLEKAEYWDGQEWLTNDNMRIANEFTGEIMNVPMYAEKTRFTYTGGVTKDPDTIPKDLQQAILLIVFDRYENRGDSVRQLPSASDRIINRYVNSSL